MFDVLNRPSMATTAAMQHGPAAGLKTLIHSEAPENYQRDTEAITSHLMGASPAEYQNLPGWRRKLNEFATQIITDPTTYLGGAGILDHLLEAGGAKAVPAISRTIDTMIAHSEPRSSGRAVRRSPSLTTRRIFKGSHATRSRLEVWRGGGCTISPAGSPR